MRVSSKKRAANKRNALRSTGPKTGSGRRKSSRNATRHGLSVPLSPHINDPLQKNLAQLIEQDGIATETAYDLAQKIIDYERNLSFLREVFQNDMVDPQDSEGSGNSKRLVANKRQERLENQLSDIQEKWLEGMPWERENMTILTNQVDRLIEKAQKEEVTSSRRYFKRSSNQLIKTLRRL